MSIQKDSRIVEVFSDNLFDKTKDFNELKDANTYIQELASDPRPDNRYEIARIMSYIIDDGIAERMNYLEALADVKNTGIDEKAMFDIEVDGLKAFVQAKSATTERSKVSSRKVSLETDEVSIRPHVNFLDLQMGRIDLVRLAQQATNTMELAIVKRIQDAVYASFKDMGDINYNTGSGISKGSFDPILFAMNRAGGGASIVGDVEALSGFTELSGFNDKVPEALAMEHNQNGLIGKYNGSKLVQLNNPLKAGSITDTELRKDLVYVVPNGDAGLRPVKVQFAGDVQYIEATPDINSKETEFRFDQYVGVGVIGTRKLMGVYEDSSLSE